MPNVISEFDCSLCQYRCKFDADVAGSQEYQDLWQGIQSSKLNYADVKCPNPQCRKDILQCVRCQYNIDRYHHGPAKKSRKSSVTYFNQHFKQVHKDLYSIEQNSKVLSTVERAHAQACMTCEPYKNKMDIDAISSEQSIDVPLECGASLAAVFSDDVDEAFNNTGSDPQIETSDETWEDNDNDDIYLYNDEEEEEDKVEESDGSDDDDERDLYGGDVIDAVLNSERDSQNEAYKDARDFVNQFNRVNLDPDEDAEADELDVPMALPSDGMFACAEGEHSYHDFDFFDTREKNEKSIRKGNVSERICQNQMYFFQKYKQKLKNPDDDTGGFAGLTHRANVQKREDPSTLTEKEEAHQMFRLMSILMDSTGKQKKKVIGLQRGFFQLFGIGEKNSAVKTRFPTDMKETRSTVTEGTHSIMKNFPVPKVFDIQNHACVSLLEVVRLMAGHGAEFNFAYDGTSGERNYEGLNGTRAAYDLVKELDDAMRAANLDVETRKRTSIGWILMWSDAFLRCFVKQGENSVWIITMTVCPPEKKASSGMYTHVLAMGKGTEDHTDVINYYLEEVQQLREGFDCYFGATNRIGRMAIAIIVWSADRPERQALQNTRKEGIYGKVSGWAVNVSEDKLPSCLACYKRLMEQMTGATEQTENDIHQCRRCCNWSFDTDYLELQINDSVGKDYPQSSVQNLNEGQEHNEPKGRESGTEQIGGVKLSTEWILKAGRHAYTNLQSGHWGKATALEYLKTCNIKGSRVDIIIAKAEDDKNSGIHDPSSIDHKTWNLIDCFGHYKFPDVPMHA